MTGNVQDLYLELLKAVLTNTLDSNEPVLDDGPLFIHRFTQHYINGNALTMVPLARMNNLQQCVVDVIDRKIAGDFIEAGVWRGGLTIFMRAVLEACGETERCVWVADSFEGLPVPDAEKYPLEAAAHAGPVMTKSFDHFSCSLDQVKENFSKFHLLDDRVHFIKGWFKDTLPIAPIQRLAIIRLDGDYFESTMEGLVNLYPKLSPGGFIIIDDYGEDEWTYCRQAVDQYRASNQIDAPLIEVDSKCFYWQKPIANS
ncbi:MAG: TylF/MycF family methyltransferase [Burkholderiales bacterium]|nr:TylF/MycF family methyltransferase [Burkholderiales bacterium]